MMTSGAESIRAFRAFLSLRSPVMVVISVKAVGLDLPRLRWMTVWPLAKAASVIARPRKMVPPMSAIFKGKNSGSFT